jgi:hypothetical protein
MRGKHTAEYQGSLFFFYLFFFFFFSTLTLFCSPANVSLFFRAFNDTAGFLNPRNVVGIHAHHSPHPVVLVADCKAESDSLW